MRNNWLSEYLLEIQFGEGGQDSKLFVNDLFVAYSKYAQYNNITIDLFYNSNGHIVAKLKGKNVWEKFKHETGKHCVQRVPPTETKGRRHTSIISVAILPLKKCDLISEKKILEDSIVKTQGGHGPGGQHQNKTDSAVRMKHIPTGIEVFINGRKQYNNRKNALMILSAKVNDYYISEFKNKEQNKIKNQFNSGNRSDKIRTYNFINSRVVDHKLKTKTRRIKEIMKGHFDILFKE